MALTGQLSDLSLAELIEFFCNQRKTGRLKVDYHRGHGAFFMKDGQLVDAKLGALDGAEAVYFALTLPNAAFDFSADVQPTRRTIDEQWTQVVLEGLRRLDEGLQPSEAEAFSGGDQTESDPLSARQTNTTASASDSVLDDSVPLALMVDSASGGTGGRKKMVIGAVVAAVLLACAGVAIPLTGRLGKNNASVNSAAPPAAPQDEAQTPQSEIGGTTPGDAPTSPSTEDVPTEATGMPAADSGDPAATAAAAALAARREREREARERARARELMGKNEVTDPASSSAVASSSTPLPGAAANNAGAVKKQPSATTPAGAQTVTVRVVVDAEGRVAQASVANSRPGMGAYEASALRVARQRRYPAGQAGTVTVPIKIN